MYVCMLHRNLKKLWWWTVKNMCYTGETVLALNNLVEKFSIDLESWKFDLSGTHVIYCLDGE